MSDASLWSVLGLGLPLGARHAVDADVGTGVAPTSIMVAGARGGTSARVPARPIVSDGRSRTRGAVALALALALAPTTGCAGLRREELIPPAIGTAAGAGAGAAIGAAAGGSPGTGVLVGGRTGCDRGLDLHAHPGRRRPGAERMTRLALFAVLLGAPIAAAREPITVRSETPGPPETVRGRLEQVDAERGVPVVRDAAGERYDFRASAETLDGLALRDAVAARLQWKPGR